MSDTINPAQVGGEMRRNHGWAKAQVLLLRAYLALLVEADSWRQRIKLLAWSVVYATLAAVAVVVWLVALVAYTIWRAFVWSWQQFAGLARSSYEYALFWRSG